MNAVPSKASLKPAPSVHARAFDDELVILDLAKGNYFALDPIGTCLWRGLETGADITQVAREVAAEYDVGFDRVLADLAKLVDELVALGLLVEKGDTEQR
jgi:hypothetical protein